MSGNDSFAAPRLDRRARRTRDALGDALVALMHEKPYDAITVGEVLERARVARSTFYSHFAHKDDLFFTEVDEFFAAMAAHLSRAAEPSRRVAPVRELFAHVADMRPFVRALVEARQLHDVFELGRRHFAAGIESRLRELGAADGRTDATLRAAASFFAGALFSSLTDWIVGSEPADPAAMDELFHELVWNGV